MADALQALQKTLDRLDEIEQELDSVRLDLRQSDRLASLGQVTATIAHELNNILTPALSYAQMAQQHPDRQDYVEKALERTIEGVKMASDILDSALNLAAGDRESHPTISRPQDAAEMAIKCLARDPRRDGIELQFDLPPDIVAPIPPRALQQVFLNLLTNATRILRRQGGGRIAIAAQATTAGTEIIFSDNGPGIPPDIRDRVFQPFSTTEEPDRNAPQDGGRGLGLSICRRTVISHGGTISVEEERDGGARFVIRFPPATSIAAGRAAA
ncbi:MAG: sensor histidine kinase [Phycisphaerales bacterium]